MMHGYGLVKQLCAELQDFMRKHNFSSIEDFRGYATLFTSNRIILQEVIGVFLLLAYVFVIFLFVVMSHLTLIAYGQWFFLSLFQSLSSILHNPYRLGSSTTRSHQTEKSYQEGIAVRQRLDRRWLCEGDWEHGFQLTALRFKRTPLPVTSISWIFMKNLMENNKTIMCFSWL